jgi:hypothetical protein
MSGRFFKIICAAVLSIGLVGQANAVYIPYEPYFVIGENYTDADGKLWEYIDFFDLYDGPDGSSDPALYNGLEAALELFGNTGDSLKDFALSAFNIDTSSIGEITMEEIASLTSNDTGHADVNHKAWYDAFGTNGGLVIKSESSVANVDGDPDKYDVVGDISAYVKDRAIAEKNLNYVFKAVEVPEPSTLAIFALALLGLGARKFKR